MHLEVELRAQSPQVAMGFYKTQFLFDRQAELMDTVFIL